MNWLVGKIVSQQIAQGIAFIKVEGDGFSLGVMSLGGEWRDGESVRACFKESDVMIAHKQSFQISARNKFLCLVTGISENGILARVEFDFLGRKICSLISYEALRELNVRVGEEFFWFVKSNEIILERG